MNLVRAAFGSVLGSLCLLSLQGCAGNGQGLDANGRPLTGGDTNLPLSDDFASIQANVFTPICTKCHVGGGAPEGLRLDAANSYALLVGVPSTEVPSLLRVKAADPDSSYIIQKLEGHAAVGAQMPFGGPYLSTTTIGFIRQWISNGAPPASTATAAMNEALVLRTRVPDSGETVADTAAVLLQKLQQDGHHSGGVDGIREGCWHSGLHRADRGDHHSSSSRQQNHRQLALRARALEGLHHPRTDRWRYRSRRRRRRSSGHALNAQL